MNMRKTKIICTLGPAVDHAETIERLIRTGMNAARFNFSHGSHAEQLARLNMFKKVRDTLGAPVATILDTKGPEIRIKTFADGPVTLEQGQGFIMTTDDACAITVKGILPTNFTFCTSQGLASPKNDFLQKLYFSFKALFIL